MTHHGHALRVQTVLFHTDPVQVRRLFHGLDAAASFAVESGVASLVELGIGDSSASPLLDAVTTQEMAAAAEVLGSVGYDYFGENLGSSGGQNRLARDTASDYIFVLNPDTYPSPNVLTELINALDGPRVGIAEARQIPLEHPKHYDPVSGDTSWASGCCMMIRTALFHELGGFDDVNFLLHCDDVDLSWRARAAGWRVVVAPAASVFHDKRPSRERSWPAPDVEVYHTVLGRLMLGTRWGRPDIVRETIHAVDRSGAEIGRRAVAEFRRREMTGQVPTPVHDTSVAEFIDGEYAIHRF